MRASGLVAAVLLAGAGIGIWTAPGSAAMSAEERLRALEQQLKAAQQEIQQLRREVQEQRAQQPARAPAVAAPTGETPPGGVPAPAPGVTVAGAPRPPAKPYEPPKWLDKLSFFGDVRARYEGLFEQPNGNDARNRARIRARVGLTYRHSDEIAATVRIATGNPNDPISTNVTLGNGFTFKDVNLNWAYLTLAPGETFGWRPGVFTIQGGKFAVPFFRPGEMVFDEDLAPEGVAERVAVLGTPWGPLQQLNVYAFQWTFSEQSDGPDGWTFGGQVNPQLKIGPVDLELGVGQYWWHNVYLLAQQLDSNSSLFNSNLLVTTTSDGDTTVEDYLSGFNQTNLAAQATIPDALFGQPLRFAVDYVYNWDAATDQQHGVQGLVRWGQTRKRGDWALTLVYEYLQREAAISAYTWSDFGYGGTNVKGPMVALDYQLLDPLTVSARTYFQGYIDGRPPGYEDTTLIRTQVDAQVRW